MVSPRDNPDSARSSLTPLQGAVLDVYVRLRRESLPDPTLDTVAQLARNKVTAVEATCRELFELGLLVRGGRTSRSYTLPRDTPDTPEVSATEPSTSGYPEHHPAVNRSAPPPPEAGGVRSRAAPAGFSGMKT